MVFETKHITLRSPQLFFDKNSFKYFIAAYYLSHQKSIKFKIIAKSPWNFINSFASITVTILIFKSRKNIHFLKKRYKNNLFLRNLFKRYYD